MKKLNAEEKERFLSVLYERCALGEISIEQREAVIRKINAGFEVDEEAISESANRDPYGYIPPKDRYERFKEVVYERCNTGEITVDEREELLSKARYNFFVIPDEEDSFIEEAGESKVGSFISKAIQKIKELIKKMKDKIVEFFDKITSKKTVEKMEAAAKADPSITKKKGKMIDYGKLQKLNKETRKAISKDGCDIDAEMKKYQKKRNAIIAAGAVVTVTFGAILLYLKKGKKAEDAEAREDEKEILDGLNKCDQEMRKAIPPDAHQAAVIDHYTKDVGDNYPQKRAEFYIRLAKHTTGDRVHKMNDTDLIVNGFNLGSAFNKYSSKLKDSETGDFERGLNRELGHREGYHTNDYYYNNPDNWNTYGNIRVLK